MAIESEFDIICNKLFDVINSSFIGESPFYIKCEKVGNSLFCRFQNNEIILFRHWKTSDSNKIRIDVYPSTKGSIIGSLFPNNSEECIEGLSVCGQFDFYINIDDMEKEIDRETFRKFLLQKVSLTKNNLDYEVNEARINLAIDTRNLEAINKALKELNDNSTEK
jgi:hypothetical protein